MLRLFSVLCCLAPLAFACSDSVPPSWGDGAELTFEVNASSIVVSWPEPSDNVGVTAIEVAMGRDRVSLDGDARSHTFEGLEDNTDYSFAVTAVDDAGLESEVLTGEARTPDLTGPVFAAGARLSYENGTLAWPEATDENGVASYQVIRQGNEVATVTAPGYELPAVAMAELASASVDNAELDGEGEQEGADPEAMHDLALEQYVVVAVDEAGNRSLFLRGDGAQEPEPEPAQVAPESDEPSVAPAAVAPAQLDPSVRAAIQRRAVINTAVSARPDIVQTTELPSP